ncbi:MAG: YraN family protein [Pseudomonadota bacterium]
MPTPQKNDHTNSTTVTRTTKQSGDAAEQIALDHLRANGLKLLTRNYRTPGRGGGEIDLVMRDPGGTLVFVEVRKRASRSHGGAAASVSRVKQRSIIFAARHYLMRLPQQPPCRFDVVSVEAGTLEWFKAAFDAA